MRILVTGSRTWDDYDEVCRVLDYIVFVAQYDPPFVIMSGACPTGADYQAEYWAKANGIEVERYPAKWDTYGKRAGYIRNAAMVAKRPDICLAFIRNNSKGAEMTATLAIEAGIKTEIYRRK